MISGAHLYSLFSYGANHKELFTNREEIVD